MRAIWKGSINFGLVYIPVSVYPATKEEKISFRQLRASDLSPIRYKKVAEADQKEVPADQIVKGFEYEKGKWVTLTEEDFEKVQIESTHSVEITDFVDQALGLIGTSEAAASAPIHVSVETVLSSMAAVGADLFFNETFDGNGRTCGTCHPSANNFTLDPAFIAVPDPSEVSDVFEVPLDWLMAPGNLQRVAIDYRGRNREVLEFLRPPAAPSQRIWGATASILFNLRERLERLP